MPDTVFCTACGATNPADARFCVKCGHTHKAAAATSRVSPPIPNPEPAAADPSEDPAAKALVPRTRSLPTKWLAALVLIALCLISTWVLLRPGSRFDATRYVVPALYNCSFSQADYYSDRSGELTLDIGKQGWTASSYDYEGDSDQVIGTASYDPDTDTLSLTSDNFEPLSIQGISALRFKDDAALSVRLNLRGSDGQSGSGTADLSFGAAGLALEGQLIDGSDSSSIDCTAAPMSEDEATDGP